MNDDDKVQREIAKLLAQFAGLSMEQRREQADRLRTSLGKQGEVLNLEDEMIIQGYVDGTRSIEAIAELIARKMIL